jgi:hypothetical protein
MNQTAKHQRWWLLISFVGTITFMLVLGNQFDLPQHVILPVIVATFFGR